MQGEPQGVVDGPLIRSSTNPILVNGPESYDAVKAGPRVVLKEGAATYRMWYEACPAGNQATVGYATGTDGLTWTKHGEALEPSEPWEGGGHEGV